MSPVLLQRRPGEQWTDFDGIHVELRGLSPPTPFVTIIGIIESLGAGATLIVHHDREPLPLYVELAERGWQAQRIDGEQGEFRLRLTSVC